MYERIKEKLTPTLIHFDVQWACNKDATEISFDSIISKIKELTKFYLLRLNRPIKMETIDFLTNFQGAKLQYTFRTVFLY